MATKDKIVNLEDLKVLSDHVEGEVTDLKSDLNTLREDGILPYPMTIERHGIQESDGNNNNNSNYIRTNGYLLLNGKCVLKKIANSLAYIFTYQSDGTFVSSKYLNASYLSYEFDTDTSHKYRISYGHSPLELIYEDSANEFSVYQLDDEFLKKVELEETTDSIKQENITGEIAFSDSEFTVGSLDRGTLKPNVKYRVSSNGIKSNTYAVTVAVRSGFVFSVHLFSNGEYQGNSGWRTTIYTIPKDQQYKILIRRSTEDTSENATVSEFVDGIYMKSFASNLNGNFVNALTSGFRYIYHFGMEHVTYRSNIPPVIPSQSIYDVRNCSNLGFKCIEANVHKTSDDHYVVTHGINGALGHDFDDLNGDDAGTQNVIISEHTLSYLQTNFRYRSSNPDYRVPITTMEEFLSECARLNIKVMLMYCDTTSLTLAVNIMGRDRIWLYNAPRSEYSGPITNYRSYSTKEQIVADCESYGLPYVYSMGNQEDFTEEQLKDIAQTLHSKGYQLMTAYETDEIMNNLASYGWDYFILGNNTFREPIIINGKQINFNSDGSVTWTVADV